MKAEMLLLASGVGPEGWIPILCSHEFCFWPIWGGDPPICPYKITFSWTFAVACAAHRKFPTLFKICYQTQEFFLSSLCETSSQGANDLQWETHRRPDSQGCGPCSWLGNVTKYTRLFHIKLVLAGKARVCFCSESTMYNGTQRARVLWIL